MNEQNNQLFAAAKSPDEVLFAAILASAMDAIIVVDEQYRIVYFNAAAEQIFGWSATAVMGQPLDMLLPDRLRLVHRQHMQLFASDGLTNRTIGHINPLWGLRADGREFPMETAISLATIDGHIFYTAILRDITRRHEMELALQHSEMQYRSVVEDMPGFLCRFRPGGIIEYVNAAYAHTFGQQPAEMVGQSFFSFIPEAYLTAVQADIDALTPETPVMTHEHPVIVAGGELRWHRWTNRLLVDQTGQALIYQSFGLDITEKKQTEEMLRESEELLRMLVKYAPTALAMFDREMRYLAVSSRWIADYELEGQTILGQFHYDVFPEITEQWKAIHQRGLAGEVVQSNEDSFVRANGRIQWQRWVVRPWYTASETIGGIVIFTEDITARKEVENELGENEQRFRALIEHASDGIVIFGTDYIRYASPATSRIMGYEPEEVLHQNPALMTHPDDVPEVLSALNDLFMTPGKTITKQYRMQHKDGSWRWLESNISNFMHVPGIEGMVFNFRDVTENKYVEEVLRQNEAQLQLVLNTVPEGVLLLDAQGVVQLANPVAETFLAVLAPDQTDRPLTHLGERPLPELLTSPPKGLWHKLATREYAFELIARPIENSVANMGWVLVIRDMTQAQEIQRRVQQQERLAAVGQVAAGIAHDFNNILAVIILYAQIILRTADLSMRTQESLATIEKQAKRAAELVQQILDFSRQSVLERQLLNMLPFMKELIKLFERTLPEHIQIVFHHEEGPFFIHADLARIQQVMMNLVVNARDAMPEGGVLEIRLDHVHNSKTQVASIGDIPPGSWVRISVSDNGSGISPEQLLQIFEPFFTTKQVGQGTGLGLAQVYGIVKQHEGYIDVISTVGQGSLFSLYFPSLEDPAQKTPLFDHTSLQLGQGQTILLIEDDVATRQVLLDCLLLMNYRVLEATNARDGLRIMDERSSEIALVLSDVVMPEMGGVALLYAMKQKQLTIPVVLLTGHSVNAEMDELKTLGLAGWLPKPPDLVQLSELLAWILSEDKASDG